MPSLPEDLAALLNPSSWGLAGLDARWIVLAIGVVLVVFGSRFYKLLLLSPGFVAGVFLTIEYAPKGDAITRLVVACVAGIAGAATLIYLERLALSAVGAAVFGGLAYAIVPMVMGPKVDWPIYAAIAIVGAFVLPFVYRRSLKVVTPIVGAIAVAWAIGQPSGLGVILGLAVLGMVLQHTLTGKKGD